ncbi:unnamed protein product, partial [Brachionus calyciflorus]
NLSVLENVYCHQITGWSKNKFIKFSNYITSINETSGRSKNQLIALYRYWLRKGIDQFTLSKLFSETSNQSQISQYLDQIRRAINKDFVPFFLGTTKGRDFFLKHNNTTVKNLHNLSTDTLAVVVDASYIRLEKSSSNHVQYMCWSEQKKDLLIKPFLVVCSDGWIIDCYGPFAANINDAAIFDYILEVDHNLRKILLPNKTVVFYDRVFKCRFIVEKQFGYLKNHKSLDNIRNTQAGHIQVDFRIACAMNLPNKPKIVRNKRKNSSNFIELDKRQLPCKRERTENSNEINEQENSEKSNENIEEENSEKSNENIEEENSEKHIPKWGALINYQNKIVNVVNTCSIDYHLLGLWYLSKVKRNPFIIENSNLERNLNLIINFIDDYNWNNAREIWINNVMNFSDISVNNKISLFGSELRRFITFLSQYQRHQVIQKCSEDCNFNLNLVINDDADNIFFVKEKKTVKLFSCFTEKCNNCQSKIVTLIHFYNKPNFVYIQSAHNNINVKNLTKEITIDNNQYRFLYSTIHRPGLFFRGF